MIERQSHVRLSLLRRFNYSFITKLNIDNNVIDVIDFIINNNSIITNETFAKKIIYEQFINSISSIIMNNNIENVVIDSTI